MSEPRGVALLGAGGIGALRAQAIRRSPAFRLEVVADPRLEAARAAAAAGARATADWRAAASDPAVELVVVSTPPDRHEEPALAAIDAGKHVLCEKPLAQSVAAARSMCAAAERRGVVLRTGFNHRYFPAMRFARRLIDEGRIGKVVEVRARGGHQGGEEFGHDWVRDPAVTGGGCLVDNGIHLLDLVRFFLGEVHFAKGYTGNLLWPFDGAEDTAVALFRSAGGGLATLEACWTRWQGYRFSVEAVGTRGYVRAAYPPMLAEWGASPEPGRRARRRFKLFPLFQVRERLHSWRWTIVRSFEAELEELSRALSGQPAGTSPVTAAPEPDGLRALEMAAAVYRSAQEGVEVEF